MIVRFEYFAPKSLDEVLRLLDEYGPDACLLAGGTDLLLKIRAGAVTPTAVIAIKAVKGLDLISFDTTKGLFIGATALLSDFAGHPAVTKHYPALRDAALATANVQVRNMGTVIGNLCNASPCADNAPTLIAMGGTAVVESRNGGRCVPLEDFFKGPGQSVIGPGEIVTSVTVPVPPKGSGASYLSLSQRSRVDMSAVGAGVFVRLESSRIAQASIVMGSVGPVPMRASKAEAILAGKRPSAALFARAGEAAAKESKPISDVRASASYRRQAVGVLVERALGEAAARAKGD
ncbi:MAG: xanthine dehydrogenase family protein subunit M [Deltaproteobacteria bacterium]|nr:xanthine dehydrogenase family protein subunit M [Deltaproteobacteria bacterium]